MNKVENKTAVTDTTNSYLYAAYSTIFDRIDIFERMRIRFKLYYFITVTCSIKSQQIDPYYTEA